MALSLAFRSRVTNNGKRLVLTDTTGLYDAVDNPTGWGVGAVPPGGAPLPSLKDVVYAVLIVEDPGGTETTIDIIADLGVVFDGSTTVEDLIYTVNNTSIGLGATTIFTDGTYKITYKVSDGAGFTGNTAVLYQYVGLFYNVELAVVKIIMEIHDNYTNYSNDENDYLHNAARIYMLFINLRYAAKCGDMGSFEDILSTLQSIEAVSNNL